MIAEDTKAGEAAKKAAEDASEKALKELNATQTNKQKEIDELKIKLEEAKNKSIELEQQAMNSTAADKKAELLKQFEEEK